MDIKFYVEHTDLTLQQIADALGTTYKRVWKFVADNYSAAYRKARKVNNYRKSKTGSSNPMYGKCGEQHHNFVGVVSDNKGYLMVLKPDWYSGRKRSKHVFQHHVVVCENMGITCVPKGWCVHHVDGNPHNNEFSNLVLLTLADHQRVHALAGATTISKESTLKWVEAHGSPFRRDDIV